MQDRPATSRPTAPLGGLCALLVLGLLVGASLGGVQPGIQDLQRDAAGQREAVRQISETVAKAFRSIVGDQTKPVLHASGPHPALEPASFVLQGSASADAPPLERRLRAELLNLPPPALL